MIKQKKLNLYLDNCSFNRPYDDQTQLRIEIETKAKLFIQNLIVENAINFTSSAMLKYENSKNPYEERRVAIVDFINKHATISLGHSNDVKEQAKQIVTKGIRPKDATHIAFAIYGECDYFITTDDKLLNYKTDKIAIISPQEFLKIWEEYKNVT